MKRYEYKIIRLQQIEANLNKKKNRKQTEYYVNKYVSDGWRLIQTQIPHTTYCFYYELIFEKEIEISSSENSEHNYLEQLQEW